MILFGNADGTNFCFNKGLVDHDKFSNNTDPDNSLDESTRKTFCVTLCDIMIYSDFY
jgi:hypothetical protein